MRIACLPIAGPHNPYQTLLKRGLEKAGHQVLSGAKGKFFPLLRTVIHVKTEAIHLDWPGSYYLRSNPLLCLVQALLFWVDVQLFSWLGVPLVWTVHNMVEHETKYPVVDKWAKRFLASKAAKIRLFAENQRAEALRKLNVSEDKLSVVPEGSYIGHYPETQSRQDARFLLGLPDSARVALHFGNLRPYKGSIDLVKAFLAVASPLDRLVLAGPAHNPGYVTALQTAIRGDARIILNPGFVEEPRVQTYFKAADFAAFPFSRIDNSGTVILAMGFGLVCVAPAGGAVSERLAGQPDYLFAPNGLEAALQKALQAPMADLETLGKTNERQVRCYKWEDFGAVFNALESSHKQ